MKKFECFTNVDEDFIQAYYPARSVFAKANKQYRNSANLLIGFCVFLIAAMLGIIFLFGSRIPEVSHDPELVETARTVIGFCAAVCIPCVIVILLMIRRNLRGQQGIIEKCAKRSGCSPRDICEFEEQAFSPSALILFNESIMDKMLVGTVPGILTRQWLMLPSNSVVRVILKVENIHTICMVLRSFTTSVNGKSKTSDVMTVSVVMENGVIDYARESQEFCVKLIELIKERNPSVQTNNMKVMTEEGFNRSFKK